MPLRRSETWFQNQKVESLSQLELIGKLSRAEQEIAALREELQAAVAEIERLKQTQTIKGERQ